MVTRRILAAFSVVLVVVVAGAIAAYASAAQAQEAVQPPAKNIQKSYGSELTLFNREVRAAVELTRVSGSSINAPLISGMGSEYAGDVVLRPGQDYYVWVAVKNYLLDSQGRSLEVVVEDEYDAILGDENRKANEGVDVYVSELVRDPVKLYEFTKAGVVVDYVLSSANGPIFFEGEEKKIFLVEFKLGEGMREGMWRVSLHLR